MGEKFGGLAIKAVGFRLKDIGGAGEDGFGAGIEVLVEQGKDLVAKTVAAVVQVVVGAVFPRGELEIATSGTGFSAGPIQ